MYGHHIMCAAWMQTRAITANNRSRSVPKDGSNFKPPCPQRHGGPKQHSAARRNLTDAQAPAYTLTLPSLIWSAHRASKKPSPVYAPESSKPHPAIHTHPAFLDFIGPPSLQLVLTRCGGDPDRAPANESIQGLGFRGASIEPADSADKAPIHYL